MTIEEKARAYDEALALAKRLISNNCTEVEKLCLKCVFPELKESEDERIRESLIKFLTEIKDISESGRTSWAIREDDAKMCESFLNYLEKQKEKSQSTDSISSNAKCENRWHKVKYYLPNSAREVLCKDAIGNFFIGRYYKSAQFWEASMYDDCDKRIDDNPPVVEWCEIPSENQKEQPITVNNLDEEIDRFFDECIEVHDAKIYGVDERVITVDCYEITARHFAKWGEKQKEHKAAEFTHHETNESLKDAVTHQMEDDGDIDDFVRKGIDDVVLKYAKLGAKWQKEQQPVENSTRTKIISRAANEKQMVLLSESNGNVEIDWDTRSLEDAKKLLEHGIVFINERLGTKSAEWSEEDERKRNGLIKGLQNRMGFASPNVPFTREEYIAWLESLPERFNLQPKQGWSEEDKAMIKSILFVLESYVSQSESASSPSLITTYPTYYKEIDWLKSLRPQPHWKPSEEQMSALQIAAIESKTDFKTLTSLLVDLKKLM